MSRGLVVRVRSAPSLGSDEINRDAISPPPIAAPIANAIRASEGKDPLGFEGQAPDARRSGGEEEKHFFADGESRHAVDHEATAVAEQPTGHLDPDTPGLQRALDRQEHIRLIDGDNATGRFDPLGIDDPCAHHQRSRVQQFSICHGYEGQRPGGSGDPWGDQ
jgi:hypothetical protein